MKKGLIKIIFAFLTITAPFGVHSNILANSLPISEQTDTANPDLTKSDDETVEAEKWLATINNFLEIDANLITIFAAFIGIGTIDFRKELVAGTVLYFYLTAMYCFHNNLLPYSLTYLTEKFPEYFADSDVDLVFTRSQNMFAWFHLVTTGTLGLFTSMVVINEYKELLYGRGR